MVTTKGLWIECVSAFMLGVMLADRWLQGHFDWRSELRVLLLVVAVSALVLGVIVLLVRWRLRKGLPLPQSKPGVIPRKTFLLVSAGFLLLGTGFRAVIHASLNRRGESTAVLVALTVLIFSLLFAGWITEHWESWAAHRHRP